MTSAHTNLCLLVPQLLSERMSLRSKEECERIIGTSYYLSISPTLSMRVTSHADDEAQNSRNEHLIHACPRYDNVFGPVFIEGPLLQLKLLENNHEKLGAALLNDIQKRIEFKSKLIAMFGEGNFTILEKN